MFDIENDTRRVARAFLVGIKEIGESDFEAEECLAELGELVDTMKLAITGKTIVSLRSPNSRFYIGSGKVEEIVFSAKEQNADCIIVDFELSPSQQRNWEKTTGMCVIDRQEVILDIFADRATTREAVLQVDLARMEYSLPRLKRAWTHLSRQRGGAKGTRGEGEKQLEVDRRLVLERINNLKKELKEVSKHRTVQRAQREKSLIPLGAIVGYTNVGKSSLLNLITSADVLVENKLFATLDPTTRIVNLPKKQKVLLTDTVGLIRKLPHDLVEAFKSTLEEAVVADFIVHVLDVASPRVETHYETTVSLLKELNVGAKPVITLYNKVDKLDNPVIMARLRAQRPDAVFLSAKTGEGIDEFKKKLAGQLNRDTELLRLRFPADRYHVMTQLYRKGKVLASTHEGDYTYVSARVPGRHKKIFAEYLE